MDTRGRLGFVSFLTLAVCSASAVPASEIDAYLRGAVRDQIVPGLVAAVAGLGGTSYQGAFGVGHSGEPLSADAIFFVASMTKQVTAVAAMQLVEAGKLRLDDPAGKFLPALAHPSVFESYDPVTGDYRVRPAKTEITIRYLLTHTAGFGYALNDSTRRDFKPRKGESFPVAPLLFDPGTRWHYGSDTRELGRIVEVLSGKNLATYFREHIFDPLRMADTFYNVPENQQHRVVALQQRLPDGRWNERPRRNLPRLTSFPGDAGLYSTAGDYLRFARMLLNGGGLDGARILSPESIALIRRNHIGDLAVSLDRTVPKAQREFPLFADGRDKWGLGFLVTAESVPGKRSAGSISWCGGYNTFFWVDPEQQVAAVLLMQFTPFADRSALEVLDGFERSVYRALRAE